MFFLDELPGLPPHRVVDFTIELHPGTLPIFMTPHKWRMLSYKNSRSSYKNC